MNWFALVLAFQLGWIPTGGVVMYDPPAHVISSDQFYQMAEVKVTLWNVFEAGGSLKVTDWRTESGFWPSQLDSTIFAAVILAPFKIGVTHECIHPVVPYQLYSGVAPAWDGWKTEVYARAELRF